MLKINKGFTFAVRCNNCGESDPDKIELYFKETFDQGRIAAYCLSCNNDSELNGENCTHTAYPEK